MKKLKKIISCLLAATSLFGVFSFSGCDEDEVEYNQFSGGNGTEYDRYQAVEGTYKINVTEEDQKQYIAFFPSKTGTWAIESSGGTAIINPKVSFYNASAEYLGNPVESNDDKSETDKNFYYEFEVKPKFYYGVIDENDSAVVNPEYRDTFMVQIDDSTISSYPVTFDITFKFVSDYYTPDKEYTRHDVQTTETLSKFPDRPSDVEFKTVPYAATPVYNETDGFYHIGSEDGEVIMVRITQVATRLFDTSFTLVNANRNCLLLQTVEDGEIVLYDYSDLIINVYPQYCNDDGVYPVNQELYKFLNMYIVENLNDVNIPASTPTEKKWLAPCYYYKQAETDSAA